MGLFDTNVDESTQKELDARDAKIASLERELLAAKTSSRTKTKTEKVMVRNEDSETDEDKTSPKSVRTVSIKLPPFSESNPELWFSKAESQFKVKGITSDTTRFHHLYALMTDKAANEIEAILLDPPKTGKVDAMRTKLVRRFGRSQYDKNTELLNTRSLGDLKPSEMWSKFQRLNKDPGNATSTFVRTYLINMYPPEVRGALSNINFKDIDEMVEAADRYMENSKKRPGDVNEIWEDEGESDQVNHISRGGQRGGRGQAKPGRGHPGAQKSAGPSNKTCFFHERHGLEAFKCNGPPCPFATAPLAKRSGNATAGR